MPIYVAIFSLFFAAMIASFVFFDLLVRREYAEHKRVWIVDRCPYGFFFIPEESRSAGLFRSGIAFNRCWFKWVFSTPVWIRKDDSARRLHRYFRLGVLTFHLGLGAFFIALVIVQ